MKLRSLATAAALLTVCFSAPPVQASGVCRDLNTFMQPMGETDDPPLLSFDALGGQGNGQATCRASRSLGGGMTRNCHWAFDFRSEVAKVAFGKTLETVTRCLGAKGVKETGPEVNHPDTHDVRTFAADDLILTVSMKDKGALQQTLIFLTATEH